MNGDLIDDVVVACPESDVICILRGLPDGSMAQPLLLDVGDEPTSLALLDFDNDGDKDIAVIATNMNSRVLLTLMVMVMSMCLTS